MALLTRSFNDLICGAHNYKANIQSAHYIIILIQSFTIARPKRPVLNHLNCVHVIQAWDGKHPFLYRSALNYYAAYMASKMSFVELFNDIEQYVDSRLSRWKFVLRLKRGL